MLVLTRKQGERIVIGNSIILTVLECHNGRVRLGIEAPDDIRIVREELRNEFWDCPELSPPKGRALALKG